MASSTRLRFQRISALLAVTTTAVPSPSAFAASPTAHPSDEEPHAWNAIYGEVLGAGLLGSVNYELRPIYPFAARVGILPCGAGCLVLPFTAFALLGKRASMLELGYGFTILADDRFSHVFGVPDVGYRYEPYGGGFLFRVAITPLINLDDQPLLASSFISAGVAAGWAF